VERPIILGMKYHLKGNSNYLKKKYGTEFPIARVDKGPFIVGDSRISEKKWSNYFNDHIYNLGVAPILYLRRAMGENLPLSGQFYYSHIQNNGELIYSSEIGAQISK